MLQVAAPALPWAGLLRGEPCLPGQPHRGPRAGQEEARQPPAVLSCERRLPGERPSRCFVGCGGKIVSMPFC